MSDMETKINEINASLGYSNTSSKVKSSTGSGMADMGGQEFLQLMLAQLQNQNPLEPMKDSEMLSQFASLNTVQELKELNELFEDFTSAFNSSLQLMNSVSLIGKTVDYVDGEDTKKGVVTTVSFDDGVPTLWVGDKSVEFGSVIAVSGG